MLRIPLYRVGGDSALVLVDRVLTSGGPPSGLRAAFFRSTKDGLSKKIREGLQPFAPNVLNIRGTLDRSYESEKSANTVDLVLYRQFYMDVGDEMDIALYNPDLL